MKALTFGPAAPSAHGRQVRAVRFEERSTLPMSAACVVAGTMRETLAALLGTPLSIRLLEPAVPSVQAWTAIACDALLYRVRGTATDAAIVLRPGDAAALAGAAFGESPPRHAVDRALSPMERDVLDRTVVALSTALQAICGTRDPEGIERVERIAGFASYLELLVERPVEARIGIALARDPHPEPSGGLELEDLAELELPAVVSLDLDTIAAGEIARLASGAIVPITRSSTFRGSLCVGERTLARGTCGVRNGRYAFAIEGGRTQPR